MNIIKHNTRPNLYKLSQKELIDILENYDGDYKQLENSEKFTRTQLVDKIFQLWSESELYDHLNKPIDCLICCESLTNGNNLTFECGHKFHSLCVIKHLLVFSTDSYQNYINDEEQKSIKIEYCCPQCKKSIESVQFDKNIES
jgi:hypothetical protein